MFFINLGWFHVKPEVPTNISFNYIGVALTLVSGIFFVLISPSTTEAKQEESLLNHEINHNSSEVEEIISEDSTEEMEDESEVTLFAGLNPNIKRFVGVSMACVAGVLYAFTFTPALYVQDNYTDASQNALDYVFSLYTGIFITSITYFSVYCVVKKNKPVIYPSVILPAIVSGKFICHPN